MNFIRNNPHRKPLAKTEASRSLSNPSNEHAPDWRPQIFVKGYDKTYAVYQLRKHQFLFFTEFL